MGCQAFKVGLTGLATRRVREDGINTLQIDGHGNQDVLQLGLVEAIVAGSSSSFASDCL